MKKIKTTSAAKSEINKMNLNKKKVSIFNNNQLHSLKGGKTCPGGILDGSVDFF